MIGAALALALAGPLAYAVPEAGIHVRGDRVVAHGYAPAWSPDGSRMAFVSRRSGNAELYVADADGTRAARVTASPGGEAHPSWSPDGRRLVVERGGRLHVVRADGVGEYPLAAGTQPAWSPDGKLIAFVRGGDLWTVRPDGSGARPIVAGESEERDPAWSPRGRTIAFASDVSGRMQIHAAGRDGTKLLRLTNAATTDTQPAWSPDGRRIAFARDGAVWAMNGNGSAPRRVAARGAAPAWRPLPRRAQLLPDLDQRAPHSLVVTRWRERWVLAFSSAVDNVGDGPFHLTGARRRGTPFMDGGQRVRLAPGGWRAYRRVGFWRYVYADSHGHWHFLPFERYELRDRDGRVVVRDHKSGFCLGDRFPHAARVRRAPAAYPPGACQSGNTRATTVHGGTSVGYTDRYFPNYHGQNLTLSGVRAGVYTLVHRVNPDLAFFERRYENNAAAVRIRLTWSGGEPRVAVLRVCESRPRC